MKNVIFLAVLILVFFNSCSQKDTLNISKTITVAGRVMNYDKDLGKDVLNIYINDVGRSTQINYSSKIDALGYFNVKFERYYPQDVMILYKTTFQIIVHPGDSLNVEFNGETNDRVKVFETVKYSGDAAKLNKKLSKYLKKHFEKRPTSQNIKNKQKSLNSKAYMQFQDSVRETREIRRDQFIIEQEPDKELLQWVNSDIQLSYFKELLHYPSNHKKYNELNKEWHVEDSYFEFLKNTEWFTKESLVNASSKSFINWYLHSYIWGVSWQKADLIARKNMDSLISHDIIKLSPSNGLIKQLALNEFVNTELKNYNVEFYENNKIFINDIIKEDFLIEPLREHYNEVKTRIDNPILAKDIEVKKAYDVSASDIWKNIISEGKDKVIYIDCWATWCNPCISEFPNSKQMMKQYKGKDVEFVYLCLKSDKKKWKNILSEKKMEGKHYFLNTSQSNYFSDLLKINAYPTYVIINQKGKIIRTGSTFRPLRKETIGLINELL